MGDETKWLLSLQPSKKLGKPTFQALLHHTDSLCLFGQIKATHQSGCWITLEYMIQTAPVPKMDVPIVHSCSSSFNLSYAAASTAACSAKSCSSLLIGIVTPCKQTIGSSMWVCAYYPDALYSLLTTSERATLYAGHKCIAALLFWHVITAQIFIFLVCARPVHTSKQSMLTHLLPSESYHIL